MNTASTTHAVASPLKALWQWLMTSPGRPQTHQRHPAPPETPLWRLAKAAHRPVRTAPPVVFEPQQYSARPLRVLRVLEADQAPSQIGRMRISGRMADVCAELDRLASHEARLH